MTQGQDDGNHWPVEDPVQLLLNAGIHGHGIFN